MILECWLSGQAAGGAAVDLLLGVANPSGKLAETIPIRLQDNSSYLNFPARKALSGTAKESSSAIGPTTSSSSR